MQCNLRLENVGGLKGINDFSFESGKILKVMGTNAAGKSSFLKGLISVLSIPENGSFLKYEGDAEKMGIRGDELSVHEGFVNIYADKAEITLSYDGHTDRYSVKPDGEVLIAPHGNEKFLLTGASMDNSRVVQQLKSGELSSFGWLIEALSFAKNYEDIRSSARRYIKDIESKKKSVVERKAKAKELTAELGALKAEKKNTDFEKQALSKKIKDGNIKEIVEAKEEKFKQIERQNKDLKEKTDQFKNMDSQINSRKSEIKEVEDLIYDLEKETASLNLEKFEKSYELRKGEVDTLRASLIDEKSKLDGTINIFQSARVKLHRENVTEINCILCNEGKLNVDSLDSKLNEFIDQKRGIESEIQKLTNEITQMTHDLNKSQMTKKDNEEKIEEYRNFIETAQDTLKGDYRKLKNRKLESESIKEKISALENEYDDLSSLAEGGEILDKLDSFDKRSLQLQREIGAMEERIRSVTGMEDIFGKKINLDKSIATYDNWLAYLSDLENFADKMYSEHREEARTKFNSNVNVLIKDLGFKGFDSVWLNNEDRLMVEREGEQPQPVGSLCLSEKCTVAILLQLTMKETYLPNIPFFVIDDILQDFDEERKEKILYYLDNVAKEKDLFILISWLNENTDNVEIG